MGATDIAKELGIGRSTVYKILNEDNPKKVNISS
ncbi:MULTISPECIES: helix-turn-helix domain-containing protein [Pseudoalteromonas]|jgi:DNA invertase Pin-like site-specific DNA recombinase|nr:helix-turn-helix domain-containing protein [Pseudoalteromonas sp. SG45-3]MBB1357445.1 helix-turn-helix domain-containing protein [Pseudoalteromonas sp. SG45-6]TVU68196.1 helix-turn-helix domain-containing protein [Pseudoalteromonas elyakovii]